MNFTTQLASYGTYRQVGKGNNQLYYPAGICFSNNLLYVADSNNYRILILNESLEYQQSFKIKYQTADIKVLNDVACVTMIESYFICFYDLKTFTELKRYNHNGIIGVWKQGFIEYYYSDKSFYCYDKDGDLIEQIQAKIDFPSRNRGSIVLNSRTNKLICGLCDSPFLIMI